jgi:geranylgeranylglycerol-phosphate geranylgeranyltransferase
MRSARAIVELVRWPNALLAGAGIVVGAWWAGGDVTAPAVLLTVLVAVALTAVANAENDYQDRIVDRVAHPDRPLPSGALSPTTARVVVGAGAATAIVLSWLVTPAMAGATAVVVAAMLAYTPILKRRGVAGNLAVGVIASLPFLYGAWAAGAPAASLPLLAVAIPLHVAREVAKDLEDAPADALVRRTIPVTHGARAARAVVIGALALGAVAMTPLAFDRPLLAALVLPAVVATAAGTRRVLRGRRGAPALYKIAMACAMLSLVVAYWR